MRKIFCDRCGKEIKRDRVVSCVTFTIGEGQSVITQRLTTGAGLSKTYELCGSCVIQVEQGIIDCVGRVA